VDKKKKGIIFIVSAPSGGGKTTLCSRLLKKDAKLIASISMTTRPKRKGEVNKKDYFFVENKEFIRKIKQKGFLEWTKTYGWYYGTPRNSVDAVLKKGKDILLSIDVKGAMNVKRRMPGSILIFILPPSLKELKRRLENRKSDNTREIKKRLGIVKKELSYARRYDYCVTNDSIGKAVCKLRAMELNEGKAKLVEIPATTKLATIALIEIQEGKVTYIVEEQKDAKDKK